MAYFDVDEIEITPRQFVKNCSSGEIGRLIEVLINEGHIDIPEDTLPILFNRGMMEGVFEQHLNCLHGRRHQLTNTEEETIMKIAERFRYL